ncbi:MAG: HEAT repeat domain-containing protein, partial [Candidatus Omnitrophica bacterium]|nr:HEAT repeat domain-containing protein [Candidatus Omnitrophota bacterium]
SIYNEKTAKVLVDNLADPALKEAIKTAFKEQLEAGDIITLIEEGLLSSDAGINKGAAEVILDMAFDTQARARLRGAIDKLKITHHPDLPGSIIKAMDSAEPKVAQAAIYLIGEFGDEVYAEALAQSITNIDNLSKSVVLAAINASERILSPKVIPALIRALSHKDKDIRQAAYKTLSSLKYNKQAEWSKFIQEQTGLAHSPVLEIVFSRVLSLLVNQIEDAIEVKDKELLTASGDTSPPQIAFSLFKALEAIAKILPDFPLDKSLIFQDAFRLRLFLDAYLRLNPTEQSLIKDVPFMRILLERYKEKVSLKDMPTAIERYLFYAIGWAMNLTSGYPFDIKIKSIKRLEEKGYQVVVELPLDDKTYYLKIGIDSIMPVWNGEGHMAIYDNLKLETPLREYKDIAVRDATRLFMVEFKKLPVQIEADITKLSLEELIKAVLGSKEKEEGIWRVNVKLNQLLGTRADYMDIIREFLGSTLNAHPLLLVMLAKIAQICAGDASIFATPQLAGLDEKEVGILNKELLGGMDTPKVIAGLEAKRQDILKAAGAGGSISPLGLKFQIGSNKIAFQGIDYEQRMSALGSIAKEMLILALPEINAITSIKPSDKDSSRKLRVDYSIRQAKGGILSFIETGYAMVKINDITNVKGMIVAQDAEIQLHRESEGKELIYDINIAYNEKKSRYEITNISLRGDLTKMCPNMSSNLIMNIIFYLGSFKVDKINVQIDVLLSQLEERMGSERDKMVAMRVLRNIAESHPDAGIRNRAANILISHIEETRGLED